MTFEEIAGMGSYGIPTYKANPVPVNNAAQQPQVNTMQASNDNSMGQFAQNAVGLGSSVAQIIKKNVGMKRTQSQMGKFAFDQASKRSDKINGGWQYGGDMTGTDPTQSPTRQTSKGASNGF